ncbi:MAG: DUF475 domain-containing protein [Caldilineae bacterium]|nr:MAG: DUF475 domain-containing protein [Caldilineae bacterium]
MTPVEVLFIVAQLIFLEGILSIDNAAVLGAMVSVLPANEPIPWPGPLAFLHRWGDRVLGGQRAAALKVGLLGAYAGRGLMLLAASFVIRNPWLRLLGAAYLLKLSVSHLAAEHEEEEDVDGAVSRVSNGTFWRVVLMVELADLAFSIDNVVAAVALSDHILVVMLGVALGIVTMRFAAQLFTLMIEREPILAPTAYLLVFNISLELLIEESADYLGHGVHFSHWQKFAISVSTLVLAVIYAHSPFLQRLLGPFLRFMARVFALLDQVLDILLLPFKIVLSGLYLILQRLFAARLAAQPPSESPG